MAGELVLAIGDNGPELTPVEDTVTVPFLPLGPGNRVIPASLRAMQPTHGGLVPTKLLKVTRNREGGALVEFECTPTLRYRTSRGPVLGTRASCWVMSDADVGDPLFSGLSEGERRRIRRGAMILGSGNRARPGRRA